MKQLKHKKLLAATLGLTVLSVIILYIWVGAFVLQVIPRNEPQDPTQISSAHKLSNELTAMQHNSTLSEVDEKESSAPISEHLGSNGAQPPGYPNTQESQNERSSRGKRRGLLQLIKAEL